MGTGLGYIVGSEMADLTDDWRWGLRVTPIMGAVAVFMIVFLMVDPKRGQADGSKLKPTSPISDIKALARNKSFFFSTVAFTCVCYCAGALMWWGPNFAFTGAKSAAGLYLLLEGQLETFEIIPQVTLLTVTRSPWRISASSLVSS